MKKSVAPAPSPVESASRVQLRSIPTLSEKTGLIPPPREFTGSFEAFFERHIEPNLPHPDQVEILHSFLTQNITLIRRMDGESALWLFGRAFSGDVTSHLNTLGKKGKAPRRAAWEQSFLQMNLRLMPLFEPGAEIDSRAFRLLHPANQIPIPQGYLIEGVPADLSELPGVKAFLVDRFRERYSTIWTDFYRLAQGEQIHFHHAEDLRLSIKRSDLSEKPVSLSLVKPSR